MLLTAEQAACITALEWFYQLFGHGGARDYRHMQTVLRKRFGNGPSSRDIVWGLLNEALTKWCGDDFDHDSVKEIMDDFRSRLSSRERG